MTVSELSIMYQYLIIQKNALGFLIQGYSELYWYLTYHDNLNEYRCAPENGKAIYVAPETIVNVIY